MPTATPSFYNLTMASSVTATITYPIDGSVIDFFSNSGKEHHQCKIINAREVENTPRLDKEGFCLTTTDKTIDDIYDAANLKNYVLYLRTILQIQLQAKDSLFIGHIIRKEDSKGNQPDLNRPTASFVHADWNLARIKKLGHTHDPFITTNHDATPEKIKQFLDATTKWSIYNIWLPRQAITNRPLALCDIQSVQANDMIHDLRFKNTDTNEKETAGDILSLKYNSHYRWLYYPLMQTNELLIFKQFATDGKPENFIPVFHTAFKVIDERELRFPMRESIEFRFLVALN